MQPRGWIARYLVDHPAQVPRVRGAVWVLLDGRAAVVVIQLVQNRADNDAFEGSAGSLAGAVPLDLAAHSAAQGLVGVAAWHERISELIYPDQDAAQVRAKGHAA